MIFLLIQKFTIFLGRIHSNFQLQLMMKKNYNKKSLNCSNRAMRIIYKEGNIIQRYPNIFSLTYFLLLGKIY